MILEGPILKTNGYKHCSIIHCPAIHIKIQAVMFPVLLDIVRKKHGIPENTLPDLTTALLLLYHIPSEPLEHGTHIIQKFVILLYDRTSKCSDYGSYTYVGQLLSISVILELLTVATPIHGLPDSLCCSRVALIDEICRSLCENCHLNTKFSSGFVNVVYPSLLYTRRIHLNTQHCV